jgi:CubicO group peptidase (beta-lactamase class C family)
MVNTVTRIIFLAFAFIIGACAGSENDHVVSEQDFIVVLEAAMQIDSTLQAFVDSGLVAGVSALVFEKGEEVYFNAFGMADREAGRPMERNTIVQIFSMTKPVTGVALMKLHEQGLFELDDPVSHYIPEFARMRVYAGEDTAGAPLLESPRREMTIRDLTRHTAGFPTGNQIPALGRMMMEADPMNLQNPLSEMARRLSGVPLWYHPGERWAYGVSVDVQAYLVEIITGMPFDEYLQRHIFDLLGMTETRYLVPETDRTRFAAMYTFNEDTVLTRVPDEQSRALNTRSWPMKPGGFGLTSTLDDYMRFARMLLNEGALNGVRILQPETVRLLATNHLSDDVTERSWLPSKGQVGFGINFAVRLREPENPAENFGVVGEFFWDGAASTLFWVDPENELTAVLFVQLLPFDPIGLHRSFRGAVYSGIR